MTPNEKDVIPEGWTPEEEAWFQSRNKTLELVYFLVLDDLLNLETNDMLITNLRILNIIRTRGKQDKRVSKEESKMMVTNREAGFSIGQIAFIYQRSKSTVQSHVKGVKKMSHDESKQLRKEARDPNKPIPSILG